MADPTVQLGGLPWRVSGPEQEESAIQAGAEPITKQAALEAEAAQRDLSAVEQNYGTTGTAAMGGLSGLTLGLGPGVLSHYGLVNPRHIQAMQTSPWYTAGDIAGTIAPTLLSGGETLAGRAALATPAGLAGMAGSGAERLAGALLGDSAGYLGKLGSSAIREAARGSAEGALYGLGHQVGDNLIQNKPLAAEALAATTGGALFGGLVGGGIGTAGAAMGHGIESLGAIGSKASKAGENLALGKVAKTLGVDSEGLLSLERGEGGLKGGIERYGKEIQAGGSDIGEPTSSKLEAVRGRNDVHTKLRDEAVQAFQSHAPVDVVASSRILKGIDADVLAPRVGSLSEAKATDAVNAFKNDLVHFETHEVHGIPAKEAEIGERYQGHGPGKPGGKYVKYEISPAVPAVPSAITKQEIPLTWGDLVKARDSLAESIPPGHEYNPVLADRASINKEILNVLDREIRSGMESAAKESPLLKGMDAQYAAATQGLKTTTELEGHLGKKLASNLLSQGSHLGAQDWSRAAWAGAFGHPGIAAGLLAAKAFSRRAEGYVQPWLSQMAYNQAIGTRAAEATVKVKSGIGDSLRKFFSSAAKTPAKAVNVVKSEQTKQAPRPVYESLANQTEQLLSNNHHDRMQRYAQSLQAEGYDQLANEVLGVNQRAVLYAQNAMPPRQGSKSLGSLRQHAASKTLTWPEHKFTRQLEGIFKGPHALLEDLVNGNISRDAVKASKYVYPEIHAEIVTQAAQQIAEMKQQGKYLPVDKIASLGVALDAPIDRILEADFIAPIQMALNSPPAGAPPDHTGHPQQAPQAPQSPGFGTPISKDNPMLTTTQQTAVG